MTAPSTSAAAPRANPATRHERRRPAKPRSADDQQTEQHHQRRAVARGRERHQHDQRRFAPMRQARRRAARSGRARALPSPAKMSVSRMPAIHGRVVVSVSTADGDRAGRSAGRRAPARAARARSPTRSAPIARSRPARSPAAPAREKQAVDRRAADLERALVPAREVAAGVVFEQREAVPQRRRQQQQHATGESRPPDAAYDLALSFAGAGCSLP